MKILSCTILSVLLL